MNTVFLFLQSSHCSSEQSSQVEMVQMVWGAQRQNRLSVLKTMCLLLICYEKKSSVVSAFLIFVHCFK